MSSVPCPKGDNGVCVIPDRTLAVTDGVVSIRSREEIETEFPELELKESLQAVRDVESLRDAFRSIDDAEQLGRFLLAYANQESRFAYAGQESDADQESDTDRESGALIDELTSAAESGTTVLVYCTPCDHIFKKRLE
jgi:hypothetical protein